MFLRKTAFALAAITLATAACEQSATEPVESLAVSVESALVGGGAAFQDGGDHPAVFGRLVHVALGKIRRDSGADAARAAASQLQPLVKAVRDARAAHDTTAARSAMAALRTAEATLIVNTLGTEVVTRTLAAATQRVEALERRLAAAPSSGDRPGLAGIVAAARAKLDAATAAAAAGNNVAALIGATEIVEGMHTMMQRRDRGRP